MGTLWKNKDCLGGLLQVSFGTGAVIFGQSYRFGSAESMGPGFFPIVLGGILIALGSVLFISGLRNGEKIEIRISFRPLILLPLAMATFGFLMDRAGFVPALMAIVLMSAAAGKEFNMCEAALTAAVLTAGGVAIFVFGFGLPYDLIKGL